MKKKVIQDKLKDLGEKVEGKKEELEVRLNTIEGLEAVGKEEKAIVESENNDIIAFRLMDKADERAMLMEMKGAVINEYVYCYTDKRGKEVIGLSSPGVEAACRESADRGTGIEVMGDSPTVLETDKEIKIIVKAGRFAIQKKKNGETLKTLLESTFGSCVQQKKMKIKDKAGNYILIDDPYYLQKAITKAERNAKKKLIPYKFMLEMLKLYRSKGQVLEIKAQECIGEGKVKYLHVAAGNHADLKGFIKHFGYDSVEKILDCDYEEVKGYIENAKRGDKGAEGAVPNLSVPESIKYVYKELEKKNGDIYTDTKIKTIWENYIKRFGGEAEVKLLGEIKALIK